MLINNLTRKKKRTKAAGFRKNLMEGGMSANFKPIKRQGSISNAHSKFKAGRENCKKQHPRVKECLGNKRNSEEPELQRVKTWVIIQKKGIQMQIQIMVKSKERLSEEMLWSSNQNSRETFLMN